MITNLFSVRYLSNNRLQYLLLFILFPSMLTFCINAAQPSVTVTIDHSSPVGNSQFTPGISLVDNSLNYPLGK